MEKERLDRYIMPDYSENPEESEHPQEEDYSEQDLMDGMEEEQPSDDFEEEYQRQKEFNESLLNNTNKIMASTPFGNTSESAWGTTGQTPWNSWQQGNQQPQQPQYPWQQSQQQSTSVPYWQQNSTGTSQRQETGYKLDIERPKQILFCDVFDCAIESLESNKRPNLTPRGIWDIKYKLDVWSRLGSFSPQQVYLLFPLDFSGNMNHWNIALNSLKTAMTEFLGLREGNCKVIAINQPKDRSLKQLTESIVTSNRVTKRNVVYVGVKSGLYGLGNEDITAASFSGIDYVDLWQLLKEQV